LWQRQLCCLAAQNTQISGNFPFPLEGEGLH